MQPVDATLTEDLSRKAAGRMAEPEIHSTSRKVRYHGIP